MSDLSRLPIDHRVGTPPPTAEIVGTLASDARRSAQEAVRVHPRATASRVVGFCRNAGHCRHAPDPVSAPASPRPRRDAHLGLPQRPVGRVVPAVAVAGPHASALGMRRMTDGLGTGRA